MKFDVLITGGGFAGAYCAKAVAKAMGYDSQHRIGLVADQNSMVFQPLLAEVAGAALSPLDVASPLREMCPGVNVLLGGIHEVDMANRRVILDAGYFTSNICFEYGHLVLALGGVVDLSRVPGMTEHGFVLKNAGDALRLRQAVICRLEEANVAGDADTSQRLLTLAIVGGGYSGVETAGQLLDLVLDVKPLYHNLANRPIRVVLVHSGPFLLPDIGEKLGATGHAESIQVVFDSTRLSYEALLDYFFRMHDPTTLNRQHNDVGTQYRSAIFYTSDAQKETAERVMARWDKSGKFNRPITTEITAATTFHPAEEYHQKYLVKNPGGYNCHVLRN